MVYPGSGKTAVRFCFVARISRYRKGFTRPNGRVTNERIKNAGDSTVAFLA
jgi:hypothetical protein